ncbi:unnamed protein product [Spodoptera exigua]|nr:unnamed protein product [Spodoptera exigua]
METIIIISSDDSSSSDDTKDLRRNGDREKKLQRPAPLFLNFVTDQVDIMVQWGAGACLEGNTSWDSIKDVYERMVKDSGWSSAESEMLILTSTANAETEPVNRGRRSETLEIPEASTPESSSPERSPPGSSPPGPSTTEPLTHGHQRPSTSYGNPPAPPSPLIDNTSCRLASHLERPRIDRLRTDRPRTDRPRMDRPRIDRPYIPVDRTRPPTPIDRTRPSIPTDRTRPSIPTDRTRPSRPSIHPGGSQIYRPPAHLFRPGMNTPWAAHGYHRSVGRPLTHADRARIYRPPAHLFRPRMGRPSALPGRAQVVRPPSCPSRPSDQSGRPRINTPSTAPAHPVTNSTPSMGNTFPAPNINSPSGSQFNYLRLSFNPLPSADQGPIIRLPNTNIPEIIRIYPHPWPSNVRPCTQVRLCTYPVTAPVHQESTAGSSSTQPRPGHTLLIRPTPIDASSSGQTRATHAETRPPRTHSSFSITSYRMDGEVVIIDDDDSIKIKSEYIDDDVIEVKAENEIADEDVDVGEEIPSAYSRPRRSRPEKIIGKE